MIRSFSTHYIVYINSVDSLYGSYHARRYTPEYPSNAPESPYYGNRLPIRFHDTCLYVLSGSYKRVMIERAVMFTKIPADRSSANMHLIVELASHILYPASFSRCRKMHML